MIEYLILAVVIATLFSAFAYIRAMFKGRVKPNRITWMMWAIAPLIAVAAAKSTGVGWAAMPVFMSGLSPLLIFLASFLTKKAYWKLSMFDYVCGVLSGLALFLWFVTSDPNVAIAFAIATDGLATMPTLIKAWRYPDSESVWPFITGVFGASSSLAAATLWTFSEYAFPTYLLIANAMLLVAVSREKKIKF
jgi:hypothetical protein